MPHVRNHRATEVGGTDLLAAHRLEEGPAEGKLLERPAEGARAPAGGRRGPFPSPLLPPRTSLTPHSSRRGRIELEPASQTVGRAEPRTPPW